MKVNLFDSNGVNKSPVSGYSFIPKNIKWIIGQKKFDGLTIFTDKHIMKDTVRSVDSKLKIAWLVEPKVVYSIVYRIIQNKENQYDYIITHDETLLKRGSKYVLAPAGGTWIPHNKQKIYPKTKLISSIVSKKNMFPGHIIRHTMCKNIPKKIDYYGSKFNWIATKDIGMRDYMFSVGIENSSVKNYFTEKIIDCFLCGCIPIYWGCTNLGKFFNMKGVIVLKDIDQLKNKILPALSEEKYKSMLPAVEENFKLALEYSVQIDWIYKNILTNIKDR